MEFFEKKYPENKQTGHSLFWGWTRPAGSIMDAVVEFLNMKPLRWMSAIPPNGRVQLYSPQVDGRLFHGPSNQYTMWPGGFSGSGDRRTLLVGRGIDNCVLYNIWWALRSNALPNELNSSEMVAGCNYRPSLSFLVMLTDRTSFTGATVSFISIVSLNDHVIWINCCLLLSNQ